MAVSGRRVTVLSASATLLTSVPSDAQSGQSVVVKNKTGAAASVDLGDATVTAGAGYELEVGEIFSADLQPGEALYGRAPSGTISVSVFESGV